MADPFSAEVCVDELEEAHFGLQRSGRFALLLYRKQWDALVSRLNATLEQLPGNPFFTEGLAYSLARQGNVDRALHLMSETFPHLCADEVEIPKGHEGIAVPLAAVLNASGETN